ncbi:hypothetical protein M885DRAFT_32913 [Pelagophyceae sp. CCMP2097]|nr:hypothetical protein M885DRAFT_32913 [Pelagophyceae sp. CCMP2097]
MCALWRHRGAVFPRSGSAAHKMAVSKGVGGHGTFVFLYLKSLKKKDKGPFSRVVGEATPKRGDSSNAKLGDSSNAKRGIRQTAVGNPHFCECARPKTERLKSPYRRFKTFSMPRLARWPSGENQRGFAKPVATTVRPCPCKGLLGPLWRTRSLWRPVETLKKLVGLFWVTLQSPTS